MWFIKGSQKNKKSIVKYKLLDIRILHIYVILSDIWLLTNICWI